jgi:heme exporter protein B
VSDVLRAALLVLGKDLAIERRTREIVVSTGLFSLLVAVLASLSFYLDEVDARAVAPGVLWIAVSFSGVLAVGRSFSRERDNEAMRGLLLAPIPPSGIYVGKVLSTLVFLGLVEAVLVPIVALLYRVDLVRVMLPTLPVLALGTLGQVLAGTLFGALTVRTGARDLLVAVLVFPLVAPALLAAVVATREIFAPGELTQTLRWCQILLAYDLVVGAGGIWMFGPLVRD